MRKNGKNTNEKRGSVHEQIRKRGTCPINVRQKCHFSSVQLKVNKNK